MPNLKDGFKHFFTPDESQEDELLRTGLIAVDTNVLLNLYKYSPKALQQFFEAASNLNEKIWIPHQVALEFHGRRELALNEIVGGVKRIANQWNSLKSAVRELSADTNSPLDTFVFQKLLDQIDEEFLAEISSQDLHFSAWKSDDPIFPQLQNYIEVGEAPTDEWIASSIAEADKRVVNSIPPGYLDSTKDGDYYWRGQSIPRKYGDIFLWFQLIDKAKTRSQENRIVFVSNDQKQDWTRQSEIKGKGGKESGTPPKVYGPRRELIDEMLTKGGCADFWIYPLPQYLKIAGRVFGLDIKEAVTEAEQIKVTQDDLQARQVEITRRPAPSRLPTRARTEHFDVDSKTQEAWDAWKDTVGDKFLVLSLKNRNYLRSLIAEHGIFDVITGIQIWSQGWLEYDDEDNIKPESISRTWSSLDEIIQTSGRGYELPPELDGDDVPGIDDIPF